MGALPPRFVLRLNLEKTCVAPRVFPVPQDTTKDRNYFFPWPALAFDIPCVRESFPWVWALPLISKCSS